MVGKTFEEGDVHLEVRKNFYEGKKLDEKEFDNFLKKINSLNIVGKESINFILKKGLMNKQDIKRIKDIPYAIIVFLK